MRNSVIEELRVRRFATIHDHEENCCRAFWKWAGLQGFSVENVGRVTGESTCTIHFITWRRKFLFRIRYLPRTYEKTNGGSIPKTFFRTIEEAEMKLNRGFFKKPIQDSKLYGSYQ